MPKLQLSVAGLLCTAAAWAAPCAQAQAAVSALPDAPSHGLDAVRFQMTEEGATDHQRDAGAATLGHSSIDGGGHLACEAVVLKAERTTG
jgi:hypothetical protein